MTGYEFGTRIMTLIWNNLLLPLALLARLVERR